MNADANPHPAPRPNTPAYSWRFVSGLPQAEDHAFVVEHLRAWLADISRADA